MGLLSKFEGKMEDTVEGAADRMGAAPLSPVQIAKKAEKQMRREKMVGAGKQYAPTLYTVLVNADDDRRLLGYYPTLAGETETYLSAKAAEQGLVMDGQPSCASSSTTICATASSTSLPKWWPPPWLSSCAKKSTPATASAPAAVRPARPPRKLATATSSRHPPGAAPHRRGYDYQAAPVDEYVEDDYYEDDEPRQAYIYDITNDRAFTLPGQAETIGRESKNDIVIPDINVSRVHAEIRQDESGAWILTDLGSTNGTFVNGRQIKSTALHDADRIIVGTTNLEFQLI